MAQVKKQLPRRTGAPTKYPWDQWLDGQVWLLEPGTDFTITRYAMVAQIFQSAKRRNLKAETRVRPEGVYVQATPREPEVP